MDIIQVVCTVADIGIDELVSKSRKQNIVYARQAAMTLIRNKTVLSLKKIGKIFNRDHSTVIYSMEAVNQMVRFDKEFRHFYKQVLNLI